MKKGLVLLTALLLTGCGNVTDIECSEEVTIDGKKFKHEITAAVVDKKVEMINISYEPTDSSSESGTEYKDKVDDLKLKYGSKLPSNITEEKVTLIEIINVDKLENGTTGVGLSSSKFIKEVKFENPKIKCKTKNVKTEEEKSNKN